MALIDGLIALTGVVMIFVSAFVRPAKFGLTAAGFAVFLLGWAVLPLFGIR